MPIYDYQCYTCEHITQKFRTCAGRDKSTKCEKCGGEARKVISTTIHIGLVRDRFSDAMGVTANQVEAAEKMYPGSKYTKDGRLIITGRKDKLRKMKERGYAELD